MHLNIRVADSPEKSEGKCESEGATTRVFLLYKKYIYIYIYYRYTVSSLILLDSNPSDIIYDFNSETLIIL